MRASQIVIGAVEAVNGITKNSRNYDGWAGESRGRQSPKRAWVRLLLNPAVAFSLDNCPKNGIIGSMAVGSTNIPGWKTSDDFAEIVGKDPSLIRRYCRLGTIKAMKSGPVWMIPISEIRKFQKADRPVGNPEFRKQRAPAKKS